MDCAAQLVDLSPTHERSTRQHCSPSQMLIMPTSNMSISQPVSVVQRTPKSYRTYPWAHYASAAIRPPVSYAVLPALQQTPRYVVTGTLQQSLFGMVKLGFDRQLKIQVAIKISSRKRYQDSMCFKRLENVEREAAVMRYLQQTPVLSLYPPTENSSMEQQWFSTADVMMQTTEQPSAAYQDESFSTHPPMKYVCPVMNGSSYICRLIAELEDCWFHYLITEYVPAGDLFSVSTLQPQQRLTEAEARELFKQLVLAVQFLHVRHVAHLDLSLENICLSHDGTVRLIDFGVAAIHPRTRNTSQTTDAYFSFPSSCAALLAQQDSRSADASSRSFLCLPITELSKKPGKLRCMSPELLQGIVWDAFAADVFQLGIILYTLLTGRPPFLRAEPTDPWFAVMYSGLWLTDQVRAHVNAAVYSHLSLPVLDLINSMLKPQHQRPTCELIMQHAWMQ